MCDWITLLYSRKFTEHCKQALTEKLKSFTKRTINFPVPTRALPQPQFPSLPGMSDSTSPFPLGPQVRWLHRGSPGSQGLPLLFTHAGPEWEDAHPAFSWSSQGLGAGALNDPPHRQQQCSHFPTKQSSGCLEHSQFPESLMEVCSLLWPAHVPKCAGEREKTPCGTLPLSQHLP